MCTHRRAFSARLAAVVRGFVRDIFKELFATKYCSYKTTISILPVALRGLLNPAPPENDNPTPLEDGDCKPKALITPFTTLAMVEASILLLLMLGKIFVNALWCDLLRDKIVYKALNKITYAYIFEGKIFIPLENNPLYSNFPYISVVVGF